MVCCIQRGFHVLTEAFCRPPTRNRGKGTVPPRDGPNPRVEMPYIYLMTWFALHYPVIIQPGEEPPEGVRIAHLRRFEGSLWERIYVAGVRKLLCRHDAYNFYRCFPYIQDAGYSEEFKDVRDGITPLSRGVFEWIVSIRPSYLVYRSGDICYLEPYVFRHCARQFGYDLLYVGNPKTSLAFIGRLIDSA